MAVSWLKWLTLPLQQQQQDSHTQRNQACVVAGYCCSDALSLICINSVECGGASFSDASTSLICGAEMKRSGWKRTA